MKSPQHGRSNVKRDMDDSSEVKSEGDRENETWQSEEKRVHRSSKSRRSLQGEVEEGSVNSGRRSTGERNESRKRSGDSSRAGSDEDYVNREKSRSKQTTRKQEESTLMKLSSWYQDGELDINHDGGHKRIHDQADESERKEEKLNISDHERSQKKIRGKDENSPEESRGKTVSKDSKYDERRDGSQVKDHESTDQGYIEKVDVRSVKSSDAKHESSRDEIASPILEASQSKGRDLDSTSNKVSTSYDREHRRNYSEKSRSKVNSEPLEEDKGIHLSDEDTSGKDKAENHTHQRTSPGQNTSRSHEISSMEKDGNTWTRDLKRDAERSNRSRTPERSGRYHHESEKSERNHEQSMSFRQKEEDRDFHREDRPRGRADSWNDKGRDREGSRDNWKQRSSHDKETKDGDIITDRGREWEMQKYGRENNERLQGRLAGRKESRTEAVKTSSKYGISNENYDVIEIQTKPFDYGAEKSASTYGRRSEGGQQPDTVSAPNNNDWLYPQEDAARRTTTDSGLIGDDFGVDGQGGTVRGQQGVAKRSASGQSSGAGSQPLYGNQEAVSSSRAVSGVPQGVKGGRGGRGWGRPMGRDSPQPGPGVPLPMMGPPFGPLGLLPSGPMNPMNTGISPSSVPPVSPGVFIPPFSPPMGWPGPRGVEMNMLAVPPGLHALSSGTAGSRFPPTMGTPQNPGLYFNHPGPGRGVSPNASGPGFNSAVPMGRGQPQDKLPSSGGWMPPRNNGGIGKAPSRGEQNDYSQNFVDTGMRPQNFIRELELTSVVEDYPKLRDLIQKKDEIVANSSSPPMYYKCDLREMELSPEFFGTKFDVILVDPPWEEYVHRAPGVTDHMDYWTLEEIMNLKIEAIADTPSFIFLWVGDGVGLEQGRQCLKKWGFRRCEDICWVKTNKTTATPGLRHDSHTLFQRSKEHCLMGIKGTVRRSSDGHIIHANIDTDVIIAEEPPYGSTAKPEDMYRIIEHFALGRRRLELFGEDHNIRSGWMTVGKGLSSSNFDAKAYIKSFADKDGKVWQGGGRNPPPEAPHLVLTTPEIEALRPKSPMKNQQQQQQSASISISTANSSSKRPSGNVINLTQEASGSNIPTPGPWMDGFRERGGSNSAPSDDRGFDNPNMMF